MILLYILAACIISQVVFLILAILLSKISSDSQK